MDLAEGHRYAACVEYDGSAYVGWQSQDNGPGVQAAVESALAWVADAPIEVVCAGRTDTGVHAVGQIVHFDAPSPRPERGWLLGANTRLPEDVNLVWVQAVDDQFHARYSAQWRRYVYLIHNRQARSSLFARRAAWVRQPLDAEAMHEAAQHLLGEQDFTSLRTVHCQSKSPMRNVHAAQVQRQGNLVVMEVQANAFLHHMVRNIAGTLIHIGRGEQTPTWVPELLAARDRTKAAMTAPAAGLYFMEARYPEHYVFTAPPRYPLGL